MFNILLGIISTKVLDEYINIILLVIFCPLINYIAWKKNKILVSKNLIILICFSVTYYLISMLYEIDVSKTSIACILSFYIGMMLIETSKIPEKTIIKYTYSIAIGFFIHAMANYIINIGTQDRNTIDIWTNVKRSATLQATMLTMVMGSSFYSLFIVKKKLHKFIMLSCIILSLLYNLILGTRTLIIVSIVSFIFSCMIFIVFYIKKGAVILKNAKILLSTIVIILLIYNSNFMGIKEEIKDTKLLRRINKPYSTQEADINRMKTIFVSFNNIFNYPIGGNTKKVGNLKYAHNMWLDVAKQSGIIPFTLLLLFSIINLWKCIKILRSREFSVETKVFLVGIYSAVLLNMSVEPIIQGEPLFFIMFCNIAGMVEETVKKKLTIEQ